jgi:hypothetical protein
MTDHLFIPQAAAIPSPTEVASYLVQLGWKLENADSAWAFYSKVVERESVTLEVPQQMSALDYGRVLRMLIEDLARLEGQNPGPLLRNIKGASLDIVRIAFEGSATKDGRISVKAGQKVYAAARDLLLSAACSVLEPRAVFTKRKPDDAMNLLDRARFGQTEVGSFVLSIECSIPPQLQTSLPGTNLDLDAPLERKTSVRLAHALHEAESACRVSVGAGNIDSFRNGIRHGVSANLCEAVAEFFEATCADRIQTTFSFAHRRPISPDVPRLISFSPDTTAILREAANGLRAEASYPSTDVEGTVVKLDSSNADEGGVIVLRSFIDDRNRDVRIVLSADQYHSAVQAHDKGSLVRCVGDLGKEGRSWQLRNPHDFAVVPDESE